MDSNLSPTLNPKIEVFGRNSRFLRILQSRGLGLWSSKRFQAKDQYFCSYLKYFQVSSCKYLSTYVMCATRERQSIVPAPIPFWWCRPSMPRTVLTGTNRKTVLWRQQVERVKQHSRDVSEVLKGIDASWTLTIITTTQVQLKEVGSRNAGVSVCRSKHVWVPEVNSQTGRTEMNHEWHSMVPFIGQAYDIMAEPMMSWLHHGMMSPVFHVTSSHDVMSQHRNWGCVRPDATCQIARA